jgi:hypothetical protein
MKRTGILFLFLAIALGSNAQMWIEVGAKGMYGFKGFYNDNIINDRDVEYKINQGYSYGGLLNINFADRHGFTVEGLLAKNKQQFNHEIANVVEAAGEINWTTLDGYLMYRMYSNTSFIEIGPKISIVQSIDQTPNPVNLWDIPKKYNENYWSAAIGFGGLIAGSEFFTLKMGLRFEYALTDFVSDDGEKDGFPAYYRSYETYKATHPFSATVHMEFNFAIGAVARAQCGRRSFIFGSGY